MLHTTLPLAGKTALITGVSRRRGIGYATAARLADQGASLFIHHHRDNDQRQPWGADDLDALRRELSAHLQGDARLADASGDLRGSAAPQQLFAEARDFFGAIDLLICNQAQSGNDGSILTVTAESLDQHWEANARATILLTAEFARAFSCTDDRSPVSPGELRRPAGVVDEGNLGHVIWLTSGQGHSAMVGEVSYATSKAALAGVTRTVARELLPLGIVLNTVNPGPVNTGYMDTGSSDRDNQLLDGFRQQFPWQRFGEPDDPARLITWLVSHDARWMAGQVLTTDGGFSL